MHIKVSDRLLNIYKNAEKIIGKLNLKFLNADLLKQLWEYLIFEIFIRSFLNDKH